MIRILKRLFICFQNEFKHSLKIKLTKQPSKHHIFLMSKRELRGDIYLLHGTHFTQGQAPLRIEDKIGSFVQRIKLQLINMQLLNKN